MTRDSTSEESAGEEESGSSESRSNFFTAGVLRVIDTLMGLLQGWKDRLGAPASAAGEDDEQSGGSGRKSRADSAQALGAEVPGAAVPEKTPPTLVRTFFMLVLGVVIGGIVGMLFSYELFSSMIEGQAEKISTLRDDVIGLEKENARTGKAEAEYREALGETQKTLVETQRSLNLATGALKNKCDERVLNRIFNPEPKRTASAPLLQRTVPGASAASSTGGTGSRQPSPARQTGTCDINSSNPDQSLARCLNELNR